MSECFIDLEEEEEEEEEEERVHCTLMHFAIFVATTRFQNPTPPH
jgi:hypothetical protein